MPNEPISFPPSEQPPCKRRWRRRIVQGILGLILTTVVSHAVWGWRARSRVDAQLGSFKAAGEPSLPADLDTPSLPPGENAADDLIAAGELLDARAEQSRAFSMLTPALPLTDAEMATISAEVESMRDVFALIESAAAKPRARWPRDISIPWIMQQLPGLNTSRGLANLLGADAILAHQRGRDDVSLRRIEMLQAIARAVDQRPELVSHLVSVGIEALAAQTLENLAPDMKIGSGPGGAPLTGVRAQITRLLDDRASKEGLARTLRADRVDHVQVMEMMMAGRLVIPTGSSGRAGTPESDSAVARYAMKPLFLESADLSLQMTTAVLRDFQASANWPAFSAGKAREWRRVAEEVRGSPRRYVVAAVFLPSYEKVVRAEFREATNRRLAAVALAARLYAVDHAGALPASFADLVPGYLSVTPDDPMAAGSSPLRFSTDGNDPRIYSVGYNGVDDDGSSVALRRTANPEPPDRWECRDAVMHLKRQPRYIPPPEPPIE